MPRRSALEGGAAERSGWMTRAACLNADPRKWDSDTGPDALGSIRVCERCPVLEQCLEYALRLMAELPSEHTLAGIWGGTGHKRRAVLVRERQGKTCTHCECSDEAK